MSELTYKASDNWSQAIESLDRMEPYGFGFIPSSLYDRARRWLVSRRESHPQQPPTCIVAMEDGLEIDFRNRRGDLELSAEFMDDERAELTYWDNMRIVKTEPIA